MGSSIGPASKRPSTAIVRKKYKKNNEKENAYTKRIGKHTMNNKERKNRYMHIENVTYTFQVHATMSWGYVTSAYGGPLRMV